MNSEFVRNLKSKLSNLIRRRQTIPSSADTTRQRLLVKLTDGSVVDCIQDYGFISVPPNGDPSDALVVYPSVGDGGGVAVKLDNLKYRPTQTFSAGDSGIFNDLGVTVKLSGKTVTITGAESIEFGDKPLVESLVKSTVLDLIANHVHPPAGGVSPGLAAPLLKAHQTTKTKAE